MKPTPRMTTAYAATEQTPQHRRLQSLAHLYTPDARRDELLHLKATDLAAYNRLPKATRQDLGYYASSKAAFEEVNL